MTASWWTFDPAAAVMRIEIPPPVVRLLFVIGVGAAGVAVYAFAKGERPLALMLGLAAVAALGVSSRFKEHL